MRIMCLSVVGVQGRAMSSVLSSRLWQVGLSYRLKEARTTVMGYWVQYKVVKVMLPSMMLPFQRQCNDAASTCSNRSHIHDPFLTETLNLIYVH